jgi:hypothetical protein
LVNSASPSTAPLPPNQAFFAGPAPRKAQGGGEDQLYVHKFYLGRPLQGLLYLLFCWTFIPAIVGFIEGLILLSQDEQRFQLTYKAA